MIADAIAVDETSDSCLRLCWRRIGIDYARGYVIRRLPLPDVR